ncbi:MAG: LPS export ABC transporter periplasmic protein LptC, partial [Hyphomicrobiaceae bacterium]
MPQDADLSQQPTRARTRLAIDFDQDRSAAFRRARRHTRLVSVLRIALPVIAVGLFSTYGLFLRSSFRLSLSEGQQLSIGHVSISTEALVAHDPRYEGFDKKGGRFVVHSKTARQTIGQKGPVQLQSIDGTLTDANDMVTVLKAPTGTFDTETNVLELFEKIEVASQNGMRADLTRATVHTKDGIITSDRPVLITMPSGTVRGRALRIEQKERRATLSGGVTAHLKRQEDGAAGKRPSSGTAPTMMRSDQPVDITSASLVIDDVAKTATFTGNVVATQDGATLQTEVLAVAYEGDAPAQAAGSLAKSGADTALSGGRVKRLIAKTPLVMTRGADRVTGASGEFDTVTEKAVLHGPVELTSGPDRRATGDRADMDNKNDIMLLTGDVVVVQERNVLKGTQLLVQRKTGKMSMTAHAVPGQPQNVHSRRISARLYQADAKAGAKAAKRKGWAAADPKNGNPMVQTFNADPDLPIDIEADRLDVDDRAKTAIFRGNVVAKQGDYTMRTEELVAVYSGDTGMMAGADGAAVKPNPAKGDKAGAQIEKVRSPGRVSVATKDGRSARGSSAEFDLSANTIVLSGDVMLTQYKSAARGSRALIDLKSGTMQILENALARATSGSTISKKRVEA